ncbi:MAG: aldehyde dehydrogenase PuuC [Moraxellaceae bacterium]|nr:MAG: aldehyde dehydrogenase PuuC [Moraxellaceae bacterium]
MESNFEAVDWHARRATLKLNNQAFIGGAYCSALSEATFNCISPVDGKEIAKVVACQQEDVDRAVASAREAFGRGLWAQAPARERKQRLLKFAELILAHQQELALLETLDMGKPITLSHEADIPGVVETLRWYAEAIDKVYDEIAPKKDNAFAMITREPIGVVAIVVPWNFPLLMAAWKFAPALAAGNSVILKPAEQAPLSAIRVAELAAMADIPEGVFSVLPGLGEVTGKALGLHPGVDSVAFTGSTEVGKLFLQYSGQSNMKSVSLECGGKSPNLVFADAKDLDRVARESVSGIFYNSGQVCSAVSRLVVESSIKDELMEKIIALTKNMPPQDPFLVQSQLGPLVDKVQMERVLGYIETGLKEGANILVGGKQALQQTGGYYIEPTIFDDVKNNMTIAQEEIFGPVLSVISFETEQEAVQIANDTIYGLSAAVWSQDISKAHRVAGAIRSGSVQINTFEGGDITVPFGGFKQSGFGRDRSLHALDKYSQLKTTWVAL